MHVVTGMRQDGLCKRYVLAYRNHNRKLEISTASTKAKSREPAYSQKLIQSKIDSGSDPESLAGRESDGYGGRC